MQPRNIDGKSSLTTVCSRCRVFWTDARANAVVVEADAFKESDVIYQAISSRGHHNDMLQTAELVRHAVQIKPARMIS